MKKLILSSLLLATITMGCESKIKNNEAATQTQPATFEYVVDRFADVEVMRYQVDNWDEMTLRQKKLLYYLSQAALAGRDIMFDQNCEANLSVKRVLEHIMTNYSGDRTSDNWKHFETYVKQFWFANGIHHHYSNQKFVQQFTIEYLLELYSQSNIEEMPLDGDYQVETLLEYVAQVITDPTQYPNKISNNTSTDMVVNSAVNFYRGVTQQEVEQFYQKQEANFKGAFPISFGLNSQVVKNEAGEVEENVYKIGGMYHEEIENIVKWLNKAVTVAENDLQKEHILTLVDFYETGSLQTWDDYNVLWVKDIHSQIDYVNGFIEVYNDPLGMKGSWEAVVNYKDLDNSKRTQIISENAQWFEDHSPIADAYKKETVKGVEAKVITVAFLSGDCYPTSPLGINLPNANWIRKEHGSKSVTMENIQYAYAQANLKSGVSEEFYLDAADIETAKAHGYLTQSLFVDMHECLGHGSGQMAPNVTDGMLKNYSSVIEETRADLFAYYYLGDPKMVELGLLPTADAHHAAYYKAILNGMMLQLNRINLGDDITQTHMRNRAIIANWCYEKGKTDNVIEKISKNGKTYFKVNDYGKLRALFGELLAMVQDIKSQGKYEEAKALVETYGVKIDPTIHKEVKERFAALNMAPYGGFVNPTFVLDEENGNIKNITLDYSQGYVEQMLEYSKQ